MRLATPCDVRQKGLASLRDRSDVATQSRRGIAKANSRWSTGLELVGAGIVLASRGAKSIDIVEPKTKMPTKASVVATLLSRPRGATLADITEATGWQPHSARAFLTGLRKKGRALAREQRRDGTSFYRIVKTNPDQPVIAEEVAGE